MTAKGKIAVADLSAWDTILVNSENGAITPAVNKVGAVAVTVTGTADEGNGNYSVFTNGGNMTNLAGTRTFWNWDDVSPKTREKITDNTISAEERAAQETAKAEAENTAKRLNARGGNPANQNFLALAKSAPSASGREFWSAKAAESVNA